jgi:hypothetical protein
MRLSRRKRIQSEPARQDAGKLSHHFDPDHGLTRQVLNADAGSPASTNFPSCQPTGHP